MISSIDELAAQIPSGASIAIGPDFNPYYSAAAMDVTRALVRRGVTGLKIIAVPTSGLQADILIGAGCVAEIRAGAIIHGEYGATPRFLDAFRNRKIVVRDTTCPAILNGLVAAEKGAPFIPVRGLVDSDILLLNPDWKVIDNPMDESERIVLVPAIHPDIALYHVPMIDRYGNAWLGRRREIATVAHASRKTLVTAEKIYEGNLMESEEFAPGSLSNLYVTATALSERGAWPFSFADHYPEDTAHIREYLRLAKTDAGFAEYLDKYVHPARSMIHA